MSRAEDESKIAAAYDEWAETYESAPNRTREMAARVLREHGPEADGRDVLEAGCGTGHNTEWLAGRAASVVAMDFSAGMLAKAEARVASLPSGSASVRFVRHDVRERWPVGDASVDLVIVMLVLEHVERVEPVFAEAARVLRPGGELFVCELHPFRQMDGRQAEYTSATGERVLVAAYLHDVTDYANAAIAAGLALTRLGEWRDEGVRLPRLLTLHARKKL